MNRRTFLMGTAVAGLVSFPAAAQELSLGDMSRYLNDMQTATAEFTQINADGTISTGQLYIKRPGRIRFEYNPPEQSLVLANGGQVAIFDPRSNNGPERFPLSQTPLSIILARNVDLARSGMVSGRTSDGTTTTIRAQDPDRPDMGNIQLVFTGNPVELRQWVVTDNAGQQTTIILGDLTQGGHVPNSQFNILAEMRKYE